MISGNATLTVDPASATVIVATMHVPVASHL
jgi:hypothetical protein